MLLQSHNGHFGHLFSVWKVKNFMQNNLSKLLFQYQYQYHQMYLFLIHLNTSCNVQKSNNLKKKWQQQNNDNPEIIYVNCFSNIYLCFYLDTQSLWIKILKRHASDIGQIWKLYNEFYLQQKAYALDDRYEQRVTSFLNLTIIIYCVR